MGRPEHAPAIAVFLQDEDPEVRGFAAYALTYLLAVDQLGPLMRAMQDPDAMVRQDAAEGVGLLAVTAKPDQKAAAVKALRALDQDPDWAVRMAGAMELVRLGERSIEEQRDLLRDLMSRGLGGVY